MLYSPNEWLWIWRELNIWVKKKKMLLTISASNRCFQPWSINHCSHSWWCSLREVQDGKHRVSAQVMKMCSEWKSLSPHACIFPYIEKSKIINLGTLFLVIHSSLLMFNYIFFSPAKTPVYSDYSLTSLEQFFRAIWEATSWAWVLRKVPEQNITCKL